MQEIFKITNKYIILATPLILYSLFSSVYLVISTNNGRIINLLIALLLFTLMTSAFIAGWFNMIKLAITNEENEDPNLLIKHFPSGVGEYFIPSLGCLFVVFLTFTIMLVFSYGIGLNLIGDPNISTESLTRALQNSTELKSFIDSLSIEQFTKLNQWNFLILGTLTINYFLFLLYLPELFFRTKNPFIAFFTSLKKLFGKKILKNIGIFCFIFITNFIITIFATITSNNSAFHFIITLLNFYFITLVAVGIFYYYHKNFVKPLLGQNVDVKI